MDLSIVIVNYNTKKLTLECIDSIRKANPKVDYEIIVVDNGSENPLNGSEKYKLIKNKENLGFSKAVNQGIKAAKGKSILLLNSDTKVKSGSIDELYEFAKSHPDAGAVGPKLINNDGSSQSSCYHFPTISGAIKQYWFGEKGAYEKYSPEENKALKVDALVMAALLITPKALEKVKFLNEKYFIYFEDLDFARKLKKAGLNSYYNPKSVVSHVHGASGRGLADDKNQWRRLIPSSKTYHGNLMHSLINFVLRTGQKFGSLIPISLLILLIVPTFFKLFQPGFFPMQDDLQAFRVYEMDKCYTDLQIPCRWVPDAGYQYGYPQFNFYPPLPYYLGAALHRIGIQYIDSVKILFILGYILSAMTMYVLVTGVLKDRWSGFIAALAYTYIPYKAVEVYVRGALSEFWAQIFFPLILWAIYKLIKSGKLKYVLWFAVSVFFLMTTHVLMTMIFVPVAIIWAIFWLLQNKWKNLAKIIYGGLLGFGLSAFFILPVIFERQFAHTEGLLSGYFDYRQHFVSLYKLFLSREWGYGSSGFPNEKLNLSLGIVQWVIGLVIAPVVAFIGFRKNKKLSILILGLVGVTLVSIFMIHMKSSFIWAKLPILWYMQFPWRFLALSIFLLCMLCGFVTYFSGRFKYIVGIVLVLISFGLTISFYIPKAWLNIRDGDKFSGTSWEKQLTISIFDYLPIYATLPPPTKAPDLPEVIKGDVKFEDYKKGSDYQTGQVDVLRDATLRLPLFDFPGMTVKVDGKATPHINDDCSGQRYCLGLIEFNVSSGRHLVEARLTDTPIRKIGNIFTLLSIVVVGFITFRSKRNEKASS
jgi:GT2 family glycosyltransferase